MRSSGALSAAASSLVSLMQKNSKWPKRATSSSNWHAASSSPLARYIEAPWRTTAWPVCTIQRGTRSGSSGGTAHERNTVLRVWRNSSGASRSS